MDDPLHQLVPDHEVRRAGILVDQQKRRACLNALHHVRCLGGAPAGILGTESHRVLAVGEVVDEHGDIRLLDAPPVLGTDLHRRIVRDHILSPVSRDMVIDAQLQRFQKGGFPVVSASHDKGDPFFDPHARDLSSVGQFHSHLQFFRRAELHTSLHRSWGDPGLSRQDAAIRHKSTQSHLGQHLADIVLVFRQVDDGAQALRVHIFIEQGMFHTLRHEIEKDLFQFPGVYGPAICRETDLHPEHHVARCRIDPTCSPLQHFLTAPADRDQPALSRALRLESKLLRSPAELPRQLVLQGDPLMRILIKFLRKRRCLPFHVHAHLRWRCERIPLHMVNGQYISRELVHSPCIFISRITTVVDPVQ